MMCKNCAHWSGTKYSEWGDCYRILFYLEPKLKLCKSTTEGLNGIFPWVPFDPHDIQYFSKNNTMKRLIKNIKVNLPDGIRVQTINNLDFFQTHKEYRCKCFDL